MWTTAKAPSLAEMEAMAHEIFERLPRTFRALCEGLIIRVDDFPTDEVLDEMQAESEFDLLGLFHGIGLPQQSHGDVARLPNLVWLYRRPILDYWAEHDETLGHIVRHVLIHEIGHHFGLSDADMERLRPMRGKAFSSEVAPGSREENASKQESGARSAPSERNGLQLCRNEPFTAVTFAINNRPVSPSFCPGRAPMDKFTTLEGVAAPLKIINVDTDMIIPKQYLKTIKRTGLGKGLFSEQRYKDDGSENPDFVLNQSAYRNAKVLVAGDNFGCGSSREHAPWALLDFGIRCVISTSFGDIFYNNCFKNGILPIRVSQEDLDKLFDDAERGANATLTIDLPSQEIRGPDGGKVKFEIDPFRKHCLINGLDDIGLTMEKKKSIDSFEAKLKERAWA